LSWARHSPWRYQAALNGLCALPLIPIAGGAGLRPLLELGAVAIVVIGALRGARLRSLGLNILGFTLGLCALSGTFLTVTASQAAEVGRLSLANLQPPDWEPQPLALLLQTSVGDLESFLHFPHPLL
jgi:hypothetical protein